MPSADELNAFLAGAGEVHLGMSEKEVSKALGSEPTRREDAPSQGVPVNIIWDSVGGGAHPGGVVAVFEDDRLIRIEFVGARHRAVHAVGVLFPWRKLESVQSVANRAAGRGDQRGAVADRRGDDGGRDEGLPHRP